MPTVTDDGVLVRARAAGVNALDWHVVRGEPFAVRLGGLGFRRPKDLVAGRDVAGVVEAVGRDVSRLRPGDEVFGWCGGAFAEYAHAPQDQFVPKPAGISFEQAAAVPVAAFTALQAVRDHGRLQAGQKVLITGGSGGVGTFAVQLARSFGAEVTAVCSTRNVDLVRSIGADHVIDYTRDDFTRGGARYDLIIDIAGNPPLSACRRSLTRDGALVLLSGEGGRLFGPLLRIARGAVLGRVWRQRVTFFEAKERREDALTLCELLTSGQLIAVIDRTYALAAAADAVAYLDAGHTRGKVVITVS
ncbi:MAG: NAD(P)-dependent alcohol dehydrogenase [Ilumatobacteraceae bacterium]